MTATRARRVPGLRLVMQFAANRVAPDMLEDKPDLDAIVVPLGGGGLLAGAALVAQDPVRRARVIGAEAEASPVFTAALAAGGVTPAEMHPALAESSIETAMRSVVWRKRLIAEGAGATGIGARQQGRLGLEGGRVGVMVTDRNVDDVVLRRVLA